MNTTKTPFRKLVDRARTRAGDVLTIKEMADRCLMHRQYFYMLLRGPRPRTGDAIVLRLATGLRVSQKKVRAALGVAS